MSNISEGDFPEPLSRQEEYLQTIIRNQSKTGSAGTDGVTFTPVVSTEGVISWTNDGGLDNPDPVNIKGPKGDKGATGATGPAGAKGEKGTTGSAGASVTAINFVKDTDGSIIGGTVTLSDKSTITITITESYDE